VDEKLRDRWFYPILTNTIAGVLVGIPFMLWGAWYTGTKLHSPFFSLSRLTAVFTAPVPLWICMAFVCGSAVGAINVRRRRRELTVDWDAMECTWCWIEGSSREIRVFFAGLFTVYASRPSVTFVRASLWDAGTISPRFEWWGKAGELNEPPRDEIKLRTGAPSVHRFAMVVAAPEPGPPETWRTKITFVDERGRRYTAPIAFRHIKPLGGSDP